MSGGSFDYAYQRVQEFAEALEEELTNEYAQEWNPLAIMRLELLVNEAKHLAKVMKEAEWLFSGDTSDNTFLNRLSAIEPA